MKVTGLFDYVSKVLLKSMAVTDLIDEAAKRDVCCA